MSRRAEDVLVGRDEFTGWITGGDWCGEFSPVASRTVGVGRWSCKTQYVVKHKQTGELYLTALEDQEVCSDTLTLVPAKQVKGFDYVERYPIHE